MNLMVCLLLLLLVAMTGGAAEGPAIDVRLLHVSSESWRVALRASAPVPVRILRDNTPFDASPMNNLFLVEDLTSGAELEYAGPHVKRIEVDQADEERFLVLGPAPTEAHVDLSLLYVFHAAHQYRVTLREGVFPEAPSSSDSLVFTALADSVAPWARSSQGHADPSSLRSSTISSQSCSSSQQSDFPSAVENAHAGVAAVIDYLAGCDGKPYTRMFGTLEYGRKRRVYDAYVNTKALIESNKFTLVCNDPNCKSSVYAFVYPSDPNHNIYLCGVYFTVSNTLKYNSRPGTIIHEMCHFTDVGGTNDFAYGIKSVEQLARTDPEKAVRNSDSLEFFCEISPGKCTAETTAPGPTRSPSYTPPPTTCPDRFLTTQSTLKIPSGRPNHEFGCATAQGRSRSVKYVVPSSDKYSFEVSSSDFHPIMEARANTCDGQVLGCNSLTKTLQGEMSKGQVLIFWVGAYDSSDGGELTIKATVGGGGLLDSIPMWLILVGAGGAIAVIVGIIVAVVVIRRRRRRGYTSLQNNSTL